MTSSEQTGPSDQKPEQPTGNWLTQTFRSLVPRNVWEHAPSSITAWGYATLVFLTVAAVTESLAKGNLASFILTMVVVFGLQAQSRPCGDDPSRSSSRRGAATRMT
jgi:hypothetical protein